MRAEGVIRGALLISAAGGIAACVVSCFNETQRWIDNERGFCAAQGMDWEGGNDKHNGSCVDAMGFAHPISDAVKFGRE